MSLTPSDWAMNEFSTAVLGHWARNRRAAAVASSILTAQGGSIPKACGTLSASKGCYRLLNNDFISHDSLLSGHIDKTIERASRRNSVVAIEDGTSLSFPKTRGTQGLGPITTDMVTPGLLVHTTLLVDRENLETLGVAAQEVWARSWQPAPKKETSEQRKNRNRESEAWARGCEDLKKSFSKLDHRPTVTYLMDREGDIYEAMQRVLKAEYHFVIRATHSRKLAEPKDDISYSFEAALTAPILGLRRVQVPRRANAPAREAWLTLRATHLSILPPRSIGRKGKNLELSMVVAMEEGEMPENQRLQWVLLTDWPVTSYEDAVWVVDTYKLRWRIEEFHMGLKTGCGCEEVQFDHATTIKNYLALASIVSWKLLSLRDAARTNDPLPVDLLSPVALKLLHAHDKKLPLNPTSCDVLHAIARLGGFLSRKSDGEPGWRTLWLGYRRLQEWETAAELFKKIGFST